jgi:hypothetical protein
MIREEIHGLTPAVLKRTQRAIERTVQPIARAQSLRRDAQLIAAEFESAAALLRHACQRGLLALEDNPARSCALKRELARDLERIIAEYHRLWHARNRRGGFKESVVLFKKMQKDYNALAKHK